MRLVRPQLQGIGLGSAEASSDSLAADVASERVPIGTPALDHNPKARAGHVCAGKFGVNHIDCPSEIGHGCIMHDSAASVNRNSEQISARRPLSRR